MALSSILSIGLHLIVFLLVYYGLPFSKIKDRKETTIPLIFEEELEVSNKINLKKSDQKVKSQIKKKIKSSPKPKHFLEEGEVLIFGETKLKILFTPGHAPGHICLHNEEQNIIIGGDLIFREGIGRFDLPGGDYNVLIQSIKEKILPLAEETQIFCGHGPTTTIGYEKKNNPFLKEQLI